MANEDLESLLKGGIQAAKAGNKPEARRYLEQALEIDDSNEAAWLWLASVMDTSREKRICLENVLEINPNNQRAKEALARLGPAPRDTAPRTGRMSPSASAAQPTPPATSGPAQPAYTASVHSKPGAERVQPRRRRMNPVVFIGGILLAVGLIGVGVLLLLGTNPPPPPPPTNPGIGVAGAPNEPTVSGPTFTPAGTVVAFATDATALVATWTPSPTVPPPTVLPTATLPPLSRYSLAFIGEGRGTSNKTIYRIGADGKGEKAIVSGNAPAFDVAWSGKGQIAYVSTDAKQQAQIFVANEDGSGGKAVSKLDKGDVWTPAWSPDASKIAFVSDQPGNKELFVMNADGSNMTRLTQNDVEDRDPAWSPDGKTLAFASDPTGKRSLQIFTMLLDTKKADAITDSRGDNYNPAWSPDGEFLAFVSTRDRFPNIYVAALKNIHDIRLVSFGAGSSSNLDPSWSPDGIYIAFASNREGKGYNIYIATRDGKNLQKITETKGDKDSSYSVRFRPVL